MDWRRMWFDWRRAVTVGLGGIALISSSSADCSVDIVGDRLDVDSQSPFHAILSRAQISSAEAADVKEGKDRRWIKVAKLAYCQAEEQATANGQWRWKETTTGAGGLAGIGGGGLAIYRMAKKGDHKDKRKKEKKKYNRRGRGRFSSASWATLSKRWRKRNAMRHEATQSDVDLEMGLANGSYDGDSTLYESTVEWN